MEAELEAEMEQEEEAEMEQREEAEWQLEEKQEMQDLPHGEGQEPYDEGVSEAQAELRREEDKAERRPVFEGSAFGYVAWPLLSAISKCRISFAMLQKGLHLKRHPPFGRE